jgi:hypothetical protein
MKDEYEKDDEFELDQIKGEHGKKPKMSLLNQKKVSKWEMDELFLDDEDVVKPEEF